MSIACSFEAIFGSYFNCKLTELFAFFCFGKFLRGFFDFFFVRGVWAKVELDLDIELLGSLRFVRGSLVRLEASGSWVDWSF